MKTEAFIKKKNIVSRFTTPSDWGKGKALSKSMLKPLLLWKSITDYI